MKKVDFIIVGFGLAGALLSWKLMKRGFSVFIYDAGNSASSVAAGLINPITGRSYIKSWKFDILRKQLIKDYRQIEKDFGIKVLNSINIIRKLNSAGEENKWASRVGTEGYEDYMMTTELLNEENQSWLKSRNNLAGIKNGFRLDINLLLDTLRRAFKSKGHLLADRFNYDNINFDIKSVDALKFDKIVFCEGVGLLRNPYFNNLPIISNKGEVVLMNAQVQPSTTAYKASRFLIPIEDNQYWIGSTYDTKDNSLDPTPALKEELIEEGLKMTNLNLEFDNHRVGLRPTTPDRKPILGKHQTIDNIFVFNGMGTKGSSLSPFYSKQLIDHMLQGNPLDPEVDIQRYL